MGDRGEKLSNQERDQGRFWAQRFRRLAEAIAGASMPGPGSGDGLRCEECRELLDVYVNEELRGREVQQMYPSVWRHLQACSRCREAHDLLADILCLERRGELPP